MRDQNLDPRATIDAIPQQIWSGPPDGTLDFCNESWRAYVGFELEDLRGDGWQAMLHPEDRDRVLEAWKESVVKGIPYEQEERHRGADGRYRWFLARGTPLRDARGRIVRWYGTNTDVEDLKRAQNALRKSQEEFRNLVNMIPAAVYTCDLTGRLTYYNRRAVELWGREPESGMTEQFCGSFRLYQLDGTPLPADQTPMAEAVRSGRVPQPNLEVMIERPDQSRIVVMVNIAVLKNELGKRIGAINCFQDITERKHTETRLETAFREIQALKDRLYKENIGLRAEIDSTSKLEIVGASAALRGVLARVAKVAPTDSTVLITGQTGTGKELIARAIHKQSHRSAAAFVCVNCAAIPQSLIGSELFGHEKGAFTGATQRRLGRFELAEGGTIFLDEVGELPMETQTALLRVLQEREFERLGGSQSIRSDVRVIAASNRDLRAAIAAGDFREDLFYRLNVVPIEVPALRERKEDIPMLVEHFISRCARKVGKRVRALDKETLERLQQYAWPGNIRELQNVIERSVILCEGENFSIDDLWLGRESGHHQMAKSAPKNSPDEMREAIEAALGETRGRVSGRSGAAAKMGIPASTLESRIRTLKINKYRFKGE